MRSVSSSGTRVQYTQPPNGWLNGVPSTSTSVRLTPLGPMPRRDTPCDVGCDDRLLVRRNRLNVGICRSTSSATTAGDVRMSSLVSTLTLAGTAPDRCSVRVGVTVTVSASVAGDSTMSSAAGVALTCSDFSANPPARTITVRSLADDSTENRPSGPVTVRCSGPLAGRTMTDAPAPTAPDVSLPTPETVPPARAARRESTAIIMGLDYTAAPHQDHERQRPSVHAACAALPAALVDSLSSGRRRPLA